MTHHPVTEEELDQIKNDCADPGRTDCDGCDYWDEGHDLICTFKGANALMDEVLARPDPLEVLEKWMRYESTRGFATQSHTQIVIWSCGMMDAIRNNPDAVNKRGKDEGWLP